MANYYKTIESAPIKHIDENGEIGKKKIVAIRKNVNIHNSFKPSYIRGIVGAFNAVMSRFMYYAIYDKNGQKRSYPVAQEYVYFPAHQFSDMIDRCESHSYNLIGKLRTILDMHVVRANEKAGANKFYISERVIEFLNIYTEEKLQAFILKHQITKEDQYALRQLYKYRVLRLSDGNMLSEEKQEYSKFIKSKRHRDYIHDISRNNETDKARFEMIEMHMELLSDRQIEQFNKIKIEIKNGVKKLVNRMHWTLVKLQQFITINLKRNKHTNTEESSSGDSPSLTNSESNMKETAEHSAATRVAQKKPAEPSPGDIIQIVATWNNVVRGVDKIPNIESINQKTYNAICSKVKSYGKETIISCIKKVTGLYSTYKMTFSNFLTNKTITTILNTNIKEDIDSEFLDNYIANMNDTKIIDRIDVESIPTLDSMADAINWWNNKINS